MSKALVNKVRLILVLALVMVVSVCAGMFAFAKADVTISSVDEATTFQLNETGIFYHEEDDKVGLNFTASISVAEYEALCHSHHKYTPFCENLQHQIFPQALHLRYTCT